MRRKKEIEKRTKWVLLLLVARIVAQFTMIIGFAIFFYLIIRNYL